MSLEFEREDAVQKLCAAYARDQITTGELETRLERVYQSRDKTQLLTVLEGLPAMQIARLGDKHPDPMPPGGLRGVEVAPPQRGSAAGPAYGSSSANSYGSSRGLAAGEKRYVALFSEIKKEGAWNPAPKIDARCWLGAMVFDLREANIPVEGIDIDIDVFMGEVKILLPPGLRADVDCSSVMGSVTDKSKEGLPGAPTIRVTGSAFMGGIIVITKVPRKEGESSFRAQMRSWLGSGE